MSNSNGEVVDGPVKEQNGVVSDPSVMLKMMDSNLDENGGISSETKQVLSVLEWVLIFPKFSYLYLYISPCHQWRSEEIWHPGQAVM